MQILPAKEPLSSPWGKVPASQLSYLCLSTGTIWLFPPPPFLNNGSPVNGRDFLSGESRLSGVRQSFSSGEKLSCFFGDLRDPDSFFFFLSSERQFDVFPTPLSFGVSTSSLRYSAVSSRQRLPFSLNRGFPPCRLPPPNAFPNGSDDFSFPLWWPSSSLSI